MKNMAKPAPKECCKINAVVTIDQKGQIVLPKDLREKANLNPNDKLALIAIEQDNTTCCIVMMKTEALQNTVKCMLGPILQVAFSQGDQTHDQP
jgi:AbrB family looped-hinge helix DNA binding protein